MSKLPAYHSPSKSVEILGAFLPYCWWCAAGYQSTSWTTRMPYKEEEDQHHHYAGEQQYYAQRYADLTIPSYSYSLLEESHAGGVSLGALLEIGILEGFESWEVVGRR